MQFLPVVEATNRAKIANHTLNYYSPLWDGDGVTLRLRKIMRVKNEMNKSPNNKLFHRQLQMYEQWFLKLGEGTFHREKEMKE